VAARDGTPSSPWARPGFVASAALLGALVIAALVIALTSGGSHKSPTASTTPQPSQSAKPTPTTPTGGTQTTQHASRAGGCSLPAGSQAVPSSGPPRDAHWTLVGSMEAPHDPDTYGPQHTSGVWMTCFAHNPAGALYAAINFYAEGTVAPNAEVDRRLLADGPLKAGAIEADRRHPTPIDANGPLHVAGYAYHSYDRERAVISLAFRAVNGRLAAIPTTMAWQGDDWRYVVPPKGVSVDALSSLESYVPWSRG
jgi:hypothetical protein